MRFLGGVRASGRRQLADAFGFGRFEDLQNWIRAILPLAYRLERLAPALAKDGPNPEYPWPPNAPERAPANFEFDVWTDMTNTGRGRQLMQKIPVCSPPRLAYVACSPQ
jgi:hypothetical protein